MQGSSLAIPLVPFLWQLRIEPAVSGSCTSAVSGLIQSNLTKCSATITPYSLSMSQYQCFTLRPGFFDAFNEEKELKRSIPSKFRLRDERFLLTFCSELCSNAASKSTRFSKMLLVFFHEDPVCNCRVNG